MIRPKTITLYAVENYAQPLEKGKMEVSYDDAVKLLSNDQDKVSYHIRLNNDKTTIYPLYCDIDDDGTEEKGMAPALDEILKIFNDMYEKVIISKSDTTKKNSYHLIFPQYEATIETQKQYWDKFNKSDYGCKVDMNVYKTTYFRLPNQLKPYSGGSVSGLIPETRHRVIEGSIDDFLFENYEGAITLNTPPTKESRSRSRSSSTEHVPSTEIAKYIDCLSEKRATDHKTWIEVMCCLRNIEINQDENLEYFITFSKKYNLHDSDSDLTKTYIRNKSKTAEEKAFRIGSLKMWAMEDNPELYKKHFPVKCLIDSDNEDAYTETYELIPEEILNEAKKKLKEGEKIVFNDSHAGKSAYKRFMNNFKFCHGQLFVKTDYTWSMNTSVIDAKMRIKLTELGLKSIDRKGNLSNYCGNYSKCEAVRKCTMDLIYAHPDPKFYDLLHTTTKGKLCFLNGIYDFHNKRFDLWTSDWIKENPVYSCVQINRDYNEIVENELKQVVRKTIIEDVFGDQSDKYLHFLARALSGEIQDKIWGLFLGNRDCGKGVNVGMARNAFEDYIGEFESDRLLSEHFAEIDSKKNGWLIPYQFKRVIFSNELQKDDKGNKVKLNSKIIKSINSGGDEIDARALYSDNVQVKLQCSMMIMANDAPPATTNDIFEKCLELKTTRQFKSNEYINKKIDSAESEIEKDTYINKYRLADPDIKSKMKDVRWCDAFIQIVIENYKETALSVCNINEDDDEEDISKIIFKSLNITGNYNDFISSNEVKSIFKDLNVSNKVIKSNLVSIKGVKEGRNSKGDSRGFRGVKSKETGNFVDELDY
jgi:hypothetical protein